MTFETRPCKTEWANHIDTHFIGTGQDVERGVGPQVPKQGALVAPVRVYIVGGILMAYLWPGLARPEPKSLRLIVFHTDQ